MGKRYWIIFFLFIIIGLISISIYFFQFNNGISNTQADFGIFGDYIGGILGTLLSILSVVFIYLTYKKQVQFSENQSKQTIHQQFEFSFFSLLSNHHSILMALKKENITDYEYIKMTSNELKIRLSDFEYDIQFIKESNRVRVKERISNSYEEIFNLFGQELGHYFRNMYHMMKYIQEAQISKKEKKKYFDLIQAQMSNDELYLLFYNAISNYGNEKLYPLIIEYSFLENLKYNEFDYFKMHQEMFYPTINFKYNEQ